MSLLFFAILHFFPDRTRGRINLRFIVCPRKGRGSNCCFSAFLASCRSSSVRFDWSTSDEDVPESLMEGLGPGYYHRAYIESTFDVEKLEVDVEFRTLT